MGFQGLFSYKNFPYEKTCTLKKDVCNSKAVSRQQTWSYICDAIIRGNVVSSVTATALYK